MSAFTAQAFLEKLSRLTLSQESIETLSLWIIHHKAYAKLAIDIWLQEVKKASADRRLVLFYLANDILQNGRRRGAGEFLELFQEPLRQSVTMIGGQKIQTSVERMFRIWKERRLYDNAFLKELNSLIEPARKPEVNEPIPDFKLPLLEDALTEFSKFEAELKVKSSQLSNLRVDISNPSTSLSMLKDKSAGGRVSQDFDDASQKLQDYCECLGIEVNERINILEMLKECRTFYTHRLTELQHTASEYKKLGISVKALKLGLDQRVKELERAHSTAMSDPSAKEDITDVGDMEIESDGEEEKTKSQPALPTAPPPLPPPPPPTPPTSDSPSTGPGMLLSPPTPQVQQLTSAGYGASIQTRAATDVLYERPRQPYQPAYGAMFVDNVYGQQQPPRAPMGTSTRNPMASPVRGPRYPVRPGYPMPRHDGNRPGGFRPRMAVPRGLRPGPRAVFRPPPVASSVEGPTQDIEGEGYSTSGDGHRVDEGVTATEPKDEATKTDPFDVVKNMLLGIAKKTLDQMKAADDVNQGEVDEEEQRKNGSIEDEEEEEHVISAAPVLYSKPDENNNEEKPALSDVQEEDEDGIPFSPTADNIVIEENEDSLPSLSSDSPTGENSGPNMDNPILQALYSTQESPKEQHSPNALELLRAEDSDQEEELTSTDLKNILDQVKSGDSGEQDESQSESMESEQNAAKTALPSSIPITPKLTNLLDQIFPQISQSLIDRKRKQVDGIGDSVNGPPRPDVKLPRMATSQSLESTASSVAPVTPLGGMTHPPGVIQARLPGAAHPRPSGPMPYRTMQNRYSRPPLGMQTRPPAGLQLRPGNMPHPSVRPAMHGPGNMSGPPGNVSGPPGGLTGPPRTAIRSMPIATGTTSGPPRSMSGSGARSGPRTMSGPLVRGISGPSGTVPPGNMSGPPGNMSGPPGNMSGPPGNMSGPPGNMSGPPGNMSGPPGNMSGPPPRSLPVPPGSVTPLGLQGPSPRPMYSSPQAPAPVLAERVPFSSSESAEMRGAPPPGTNSAPLPPVDYNYRTPPLGMGARGHLGGPRLRIAYRPMGRLPPQGFRPMRPRFP